MKLSFTLLFKTLPFDAKIPHWELVFLIVLSACHTLSAQKKHQRPLDDIVLHRVAEQKRPLAFAPVREADVFWKKRIWRVIDTREKMNNIFQYPVAPFFDILTTAILAGELTAYHPEDDAFTTPLVVNQLKQSLYQCDTFEIVHPTTYEVTIQVLCNDINPEDIVRYRVKEIRFFDTSISRMRTRILGIAPLREIFDDNGHFKYEMPLFWVYYPHARALLAKHHIFNEHSDAKVMTWEDLFEMRKFSSYIYKASNVRNERLQDYLSGKDLLQEASKLERSLFNFEHDLWSY